jgi:hypothetical protein
VCFRRNKRNNMFGRFDARLRRLEVLSPDRTWLHESGLGRVCKL